MSNEDKQKNESPGNEQPEVSPATGEPIDESKKFKNLDWTMARTVVLSILIGLMASFAAKGLLIAINFTEKWIHPVPLQQLVMEQGIENAEARHKS